MCIAFSSSLFHRAIIHKKSRPDTAQQNEIVERKIQPFLRLLKHFC